MVLDSLGSIANIVGPTVGSFLKNGGSEKSSSSENGGLSLEASNLTPKTGDKTDLFSAFLGAGEEEEGGGFDLSGLFGGEKGGSADALGTIASMFTGGGGFDLSSLFGGEKGGGFDLSSLFGGEKGGGFDLSGLFGGGDSGKAEEKGDDTGKTIAKTVAKGAAMAFFPPAAPFTDKIVDGVFGLFS